MNVAEILWVVAGAVLTAVIAAAVGFWTVREARDAARDNFADSRKDQ
ncbi:MAG: hypothetical protein KBH81_03650 [Phycisphaerae bacterium]|nr:hypothetical protein [Phycisphaerae bacterium]HOO16890.1 hypothetical protein [Phycisphaerae bacterium]HPC21784.1 hypothetical protein [Phycisphaerae bacterium]HRS27919.1 hypothetical protein [Phycisphaerae bacterium]HRT41323.1 hypothetical protein [Phycisphaerae bacterium]